MSDDFTPLAPADDFEPLAEQPRYDVEDLPTKAALTKWATEVGSRVPPERNAEVLRISAATGLNPQTVHDHFDTFKADQDAKQFDYEKFATEHPILSEYMQSPERAGLVKDDVEALKGAEWALTGRWGSFASQPGEKNEYGQELAPGTVRSQMVTPPVWGAVLRDAFLKTELALRQSSQYLQVATSPAAPGMDPELLKDPDRVAELKAKVGAKKDYGFDSILGRSFEFVANLVPMIMGTVASSVAGGAVAGPPGAIVAPLAFNFMLGVGPDYAQRRQVIDQTGKTGDLDTEESALAWSAGVGWVNSMLMTAGLNPVFQSVVRRTGLQAIEKGGAKAIEKILADETVGQVFKRAAIELGKDTAQGIATLQAMTLVSSLSQEKFRSGTVGDDFEWARIGEEQKETFKEGALAMVFLAGSSLPFRQYAREVGKAQTLAKNQERMTRVVEAIQKTKSAEIAPGEIEGLLGKMAPGEHVFTDRVEFDKLYQAKGLDPKEVAAKAMGDGGKAWEAAATTGEIAIPAETFLAKLARTSEGLALTEISRFSQADETPKQSKAEVTRVAKKIKEQAETAKAAGLDAPIDQIRADFAKKMKAAGRPKIEAESTAEIAARSYVWAGAESGIDPMQLYTKDFPVSVFAGGERRAGELEQPAYHGSPHVFDRFDLSKIGTGEGAQSYGHGLYFTSEPKVAEQYRTGLVRAKGGRPRLLVDGEPAPSGFLRQSGTTSTYPIEHMVYDDIAQAMNSGRKHLGLKGPGLSEYAVSEVRKQAERDFARLSESTPLPGSADAIERPTLLAYYENRMKAAQAVDPKRLGLQDPTGSIHKVDLPENLLAWDKTLAEQPEIVAQLEKAGVLTPMAHGDFALTLNGPKGEGTRIRLGEEYGKTFYDRIGMRDPKAASEKLREIGIPGHSYVGDSSGVRNFVIYDDAAIKPLARGASLAELENGVSVKFEQKGKDNAERGFVRLSLEGESLKADIYLPKADASTVPHELMHFFKKIIERLSQKEGAGQGLKDAHEAILKDSGYKDQAEYAAADAERRALSAKEKRTPQESARLNDLVAKEERFSHEFEMFLAEGKAPSKELLPVFARFKVWMQRIYGDKGVQEQFRRVYGEDLGLSETMRNVFRRMLAGEEAVKEAAAGLFAEVPKVNLTPEEQKESDQFQELAKIEAEQSIRRLIATEDRAADREFMKGERTRIMGEVEGELAKDRTYAAIDGLKKGDVNGTLGKLDRAEVAKAYGEDVAKALPDDIFVKVLGTGLPADAVAEVAGFASGAEMVRAMVGTQPKAKAVSREVARRMREEFPALLDRPALLADVARAEMADSPMLRDGVLRLRALAREAGVETKIPTAKEITEAAAEALQDTTYRDLRPDRFDMAAKASARRMAELKDPKKRMDEYEAYLVNRAMVRASTDFIAAHEKARGEIAPYQTDAMRAKIGKAQFKTTDPVTGEVTISQPFLEKMDALLANFDLLKSTSAKEIEARAGQLRDLQKWVEERRLDGDDIVIPDSILKKLDRTTSWQDLTVSEMADLRDAVKSIAHQAKRRTEFIVAGKVFDTDYVISLLSSSLLNETDRRVANPLGGDQLLTAKDRAERLGRQLLYSVERPELMYRALDGGKDTGPWQDLAWRSLSDASYKFYDLVRESAGVASKVLRELPAAERKRIKTTRFEVDGEKYTSENVIKILADAANDSNLTKMLKGMSDPRLSTQFGKMPWRGARTFEEIISHATQKDVDIANALVRAAEKHWLETVRVETEMYGIAPPKVKGRPFKFIGAEGKELVLEGGYFPMAYSNLFRVGKVQAEAAALQANGLPGLFSPHYDRVMTPQGYTEKRIENYARPLDLTLDAIPRKLVMTAKDIAFREAGIQLYRVLTDERVMGALTQAYGKEGYAVVMSHLKDSVNDVMLPDAGAGVWLQGINKARGLVSNAIFGLNVAQTAQNLADFAGTSAEVQQRYVMKAMLDLGKNHEEMVKQMLAEAPEMRLRNDKFAESFQAQIKDVFKKSELALKWDDAKQLMMIPFEATNHAVEAPVYWGKKYEWLSTHPGDEAGAIQAAQRSVRTLFGGKRTVDLPPVMRDQVLRNFTMFYGWANAQLNLFIKSTQTAGNEWSEGRKMAAVKVLAKVYATLWAKNLASELLVGKAPEDYNGDGKVGPDDVGRWVAMRGLLTLPLSTPFLGSTVRAATGPNTRDVSMTPWLNLANSGARTLKATTDLVFSGEVPDEDASIKLFLSWLELGGTVAGAPVNQIRSTGKYWMNRDPSATPVQDIFGTAFGPARDGKIGALLE